MVFNIGPRRNPLGIPPAPGRPRLLHRKIAPETRSALVEMI
jgi:hypothetical protein